MTGQRHPQHAARVALELGPFPGRADLHHRGFLAGVNTRAECRRLWPVALPCTCGHGYQLWSTCTWRARARRRRAVVHGSPAAVLLGPPLPVDASDAPVGPRDSTRVAVAFDAEVVSAWQLLSTRKLASGAVVTARSAPSSKGSTPASRLPIRCPGTRSQRSLACPRTAAELQ